MSRQLSKTVGMRIADRYSITGVIGSGAMGLVYRAIPFEDPSHEVAIKIIQTGKRLSTSDLINFQKEAALMSQLYHSNIITFHELGLIEQKGDDIQSRFHSGYYIVMEIANGVDLKDLLKRVGRKPLEEFFEIAIQITDALDYTHGKNIIHRDIKPQNIIVNQETRGFGRLEVKVLDFGVARLAETMHFTGASSPVRAGSVLDDIAGTPLYMAPEQSPLLEAPIDHRIDLYSLGCVLYEILAGKPPFTHKTREKLQRAHAYEEPEPLRNLRPDTPPILERIVFKLLEKNPNYRYQSAFGLLSDLHQARLSYKNKHTPLFELGRKDKFKSVTAAINMVGRDAELELLQSTYDSLNAEQARSRITILQGSAGAGKTRILNAFRSYLTKKQVRFISGSFSQHETNLPYNALANAFNDYLLKVLQSQPRETEELREKFRNVLGPSVYQVASVVPSILAFMEDEEQRGEVYEVYENDTSEEVNPTFVKAFSDFTRCLATDNQPVVFIFDNLHWADDKSLQLVDEFFSYNNSQRFYLVVACRHEEGGGKERLDRFFQKFEKLRRRFGSIRVEPLSIEDTRDICYDMLGAPGSVGDDLIRALYGHTKGNALHLVDHMKALVARDLLSPSQEGPAWDYDIARLKNYSMPFDTIDLVLSKIHDLIPEDREQLQIAATIGLTFPAQVVYAVSGASKALIDHAMSTAQSLGIIALSLDSIDADALSFRFRHRKARDAIYNSIPEPRQRELHTQIADAVLAGSPKLDSQHVFAVAHHYNRAVGAVGQCDDLALAMKALTANIRAAERATKGDSALTAEKYLENALKLCARFDSKIATPEQIAWIRERLASLSERRRHHGTALALYGQILATPVPPAVWARVAYKMVRLQQIGGIVTKSGKLIKTALARFRYPEPRSNAWASFLLYWAVLKDVLELKGKGGRLRQLLHRLKASVARAERIVDTFRSPADFYNIGAQVKVMDDAKSAIAYHNLSWKHVGAGSSPFLVFSLLLYRACVFATFGFKKTAYLVFDCLFQVVQHDKDRHLYGLVCLYKSLTIDYVNARFEEVETNSLRALKYISSSRGRHHFALAILLRSYISLERGNLAETVRYCRNMPEIIPTRNNLTPRAFAINMFVFLLKGARDSIVKYGDYLVKRRVQVAARQDDLFMHLNQCMVCLARGEFDAARRYFIAAVDGFTGHKRGGFLFPFEEEFVGLFLCAFPMIFEQEVGKRIMRDGEIAAFNRRLHRRFFGIRLRNSATFLLLRARFQDISGGGAAVRKLYDEAIRRANENNNKLALAFGYLWFGEHFLRSGNRNKVHYIKRALEVAAQYDIGSLCDFIRTKYQAYDFNVDPRQQEAGGPQARSQFSDFGSALVVANLKTLSDALASSSPVADDVAAVIRNFESEYKFNAAYVLVNAGDRPHVFHRTAECAYEGELGAYLEPYLNIRSTLFLPASDTPWAQGEVSLSTGGQYTFTSSEPVGGPASGDDAEATFVTNKTEGTAKVASATAHLTRAQTLTGHSSGTNQQKVAMNAILPIKYMDGNIGVLFLEGVLEKQKGREIQRRVELDLVAAQLGVLLVQKGRVPAAAGPVIVDVTIGPVEDSEGGAERPGNPGFSIEAANYLKFSPGAIQLENVNWMKVWHFGKPRTSRESVWYLGVNLGDSKYLLAFAQLMGATDSRDRINSMLWNQLIVQRSLATMTSSETITPEEIRDLFAGIIRSVDDFSRLETISIAFSLFDRREQSMSGGHFGQSRPLVLGIENQITPYNEVVLNFQSGRELRYWDVAASMAEQRPYLLSYDTSHMSLVNEEGSLQTFREEARQSRDRVGLHDALEKAVRGNGLPRYYVASIMTPPANRAGKRDKIDLAG